MTVCDTKLGANCINTVCDGLDAAFGHQGGKQSKGDEVAVDTLRLALGKDRVAVGEVADIAARVACFARDGVAAQKGKGQKKCGE